MNIKDYKCKCGHDDFFLADKGNNQIGVYCSSCGKWLKWANKDERNLQEPTRIIDISTQNIFSTKVRGAGYMKKYRIANEADKEKFYRKLCSEIENDIWKELITGQNEYLEVEVNIVPVKSEGSET